MKNRVILYCDINHCCTQIEKINIAKKIEKSFFEGLGFTISIKVSFNEVLVKLGLDIIKLAELVGITCEKCQEKVKKLVARNLLFVEKFIIIKPKILGEKTISKIQLKYGYEKIKKYGLLLYKELTVIDLKQDHAIFLLVL